MRINVAVPEAQVSAPVIDAALESVTRLNEQMLADKQIPSFETGLKRGVRWKPEPPGAEHFDHAATVLHRAWGDCDDLAPWHAASLRHSGADPEARAVVKKSGPKRWHAVVQRSDGSVDDPSRRAGMGGQHEYLGIVGGALPLMREAPSAVVGSDANALTVRPQIALRPFGEGMQARTDCPWFHGRVPSDYAMVTTQGEYLAEDAIRGACEGALELAEAAGYAHPEHLERIACLRDAVSGADYHELAGEYGPDIAHAAIQVVGSFFGRLGKIAKGALKVAAPVTSFGLKFIPGVGPVASSAFDFARSHFPSGIPSLPGRPSPASPQAAPNIPGLATIPTLSPGRRLVINLE